MMTAASAAFGPQTTGLLIGLAIMVPILLLRNARPRKLRVELLWIRPAIWVVIAVLSFTQAPPPMSAAGLAIMTASLAAGAVLGWQRGRLMRIEVDPETHQMTLRASPAAMLFIVVLMVLRVSIHNVAIQNLGRTHLPITVLVDALILFSLGLMLTQSAEMWIRGRRLLTQAQAAKAVA
ncbi:MAG TPA: hypothetical protein VGI79_03965 [Caulobacteraceae bacterium]|jgi:hypothetical protein